MDREPAEDRLHHRLTGLDVDQLVTGGVPVQRAAMVGRDPRDRHVVVGEEHLTTGDGIASQREEVGADVARKEGLVLDRRRPVVLNDLGVDNRRRRMPVVEERGLP
jgi:hypothetical protein